jgi:hypothetical protein
MLTTVEASAIKNEQSAKANQETPSVAEQVSKEQEDATLSEVVEARTANANFYERTDGQKQAEIFPQAIRYFSPEADKWFNYNPALGEIQNNKTEQGTSVADYSYQNKKGDMNHYFYSRLSENKPMLMEYQDYRMSLLPTNEKGKAIQAKAKKTTEDSSVEIKEDVTNFRGKTKKEITGIRYPLEDGMNYEYDVVNPFRTH